ncbi:unnamed protein product [Candida verbasci]|uniref:Uncharacterized protein n=1 Tax=Candida verbasci TaxID=1227364 RepID=A0A9W4TZA7_9ASCO|nr:unnamed protein product [Candida verbasci]
MPFTGFKITRQYKITGYASPASMHFITISHCNQGKVDYQKVLRVDSSSVINWDKPFCMLKPKLGENNLKVNEEGDVDDDEFIGIFGFIMLKGKKLQNLLRKKIDISLEQLSNGKWVEYSGKNKQFKFEKFKLKDPLESLKYESKNLICYKMARRKKYAKRKISFYIPQTFVGGLFECFLPLDIKQQILTDFVNSNDLIIQQFEFNCDPQLSRPIMPLIAEDSTVQWFENKLLNFINPGIIQTIPYLSTASPWDLRFSISETPDMFKDTWATKIEINENYNYNEADLHVITKAITYSANLLNKIISPIDINNLVKNYNKASNRENPAIEQLVMNQYNLTKEERINLWFGLGNKESINKVLTKIERFWDNLTNE